MTKSCLVRYYSRNAHPRDGARMWRDERHAYLSTRIQYPRPDRLLGPEQLVSVSGHCLHLPGKPPLLAAGRDRVADGPLRGSERVSSCRYGRCVWQIEGLHPALSLRSDHLFTYVEPTAWLRMRWRVYKNYLSMYWFLLKLIREQSERCV